MNQPEAGLPVAIYARISRDREGAGLGVDRQEADCRALAERLGWTVVAVFVDNDISAYDRRKIRPEYRALLDAVRAGEVQGVIAWHPDRLHRRASELEEFINFVETNGLEIQTVQAGTYDLATSSGRMVARMLGAAAQHEVEHARERVQRAKVQRAKAGLYRGGPRPFGYEPGGMVVRESEAAVVREATKAVLAGRTLRAIADELNESGVKPATMARKDSREPRPGQGPWRYNNLRDMLLRPRNAGIVARGLPNRNSETSKSARKYEEIGKAQWPAIVAEDEWRALVTLLTDPSRRTNSNNETKWLGSGIYLCGKCGSPLRATPHGGTAMRPYERRYLYRCVASAHLTVGQRQTDEFVLDLVAELVRDPNVVAAMQPSNSHLAADRQKRSVLSTRLAGFENDYALGVITGAQLQKATSAVTAELAEVDARMAKGLGRSASSVILRAPDPGQAFLDAAIDIQRAVLTSVVTVTVVPALTRGSAWSADRLQVTPVEV